MKDHCTIIHIFLQLSVNRHFCLTKETSFHCITSDCTHKWPVALYNTTELYYNNKIAIITRTFTLRFHPEIFVLEQLLFRKKVSSWLVDFKIGLTIENPSYHL